MPIRRARIRSSIWTHPAQRTQWETSNSGKNATTISVVSPSIDPDLNGRHYGIPKHASLLHARGSPKSTLTIAQAFIQAGQQFVAGRLEEAESMGHQILAADPGHSDTINLLGLIACRRGDFQAASALFRQAIETQPKSAPFYNNLSVALNALGNLEAAEDAARFAAELAPDYVEAWFNLALVRGNQEKLDEAAAAYRMAIKLKGDSVAAWTNLGNILKRQGRIEEALRAYRQAVTLDPRNAEAHGVLVQNLRYDVASDAAAIAREEALWDARHGAPLGQGQPAHENEPDPQRRLRVGYVSPDFRDHVVGLNVLPLLEGHDRRQFDAFCYSDVTRPDSITGRFRAAASHWRDTARMSDEALAGTIRGDGVDILVDLALHTAGNRLAAFARRPAPVQVSFAGYPGATGLSAIEHRISDRYLEGAPDANHPTEQPGVHLIESFWCYAALATPLEVTPLPSLETGRLSFGCLNHCWKVSARMLRLWAHILRNVSASRLLLQSPQGSHRADTLAILDQEGISAERVEFLERQPRFQYLRTYQRIDLALDTFPYNGHTTSLDAFWMGVPVVSLAGETIVSRAGLSQATNLGLPELVARSDADYVRIATGLALDPARLGHLRATMRERMNGSVLMDASRFTQGIERAYRTIWHEWCARHAPHKGIR
jgi:predicted O-linked N-acetylglucosamine transferase (SPINDLY family)